MGLTLREWSAIVSATLVIVGTFWYVTLVLLRIKIRPVLASWIVLAGTMTLSFATYWTSPRHSLVSNACNAASVISTLAILGAVIWIHWKTGGELRFSLFQKWCLGVSASIAALWITLVWGLHRTGTVPNVMTQILMLIGYLVTAEKLWRATKNTESFFTWGCIMIASAIALYTAWVSRDVLAGLYATRATLASATIVVLMYRLERRQNVVLETVTTQ